MVVAYAVAAAEGFWLAGAKLCARWDAVTAMLKAVSEFAKLGTTSGQPHPATMPAGLR